MPNYVVINSNRIEILGRVTERQVTPWSSKISMGTKEFADFLPCSIQEYSDLTGGLGIDKTASEINRIAWSKSVETTKAGDIRLGPEIVTAGAYNATPLKLIEFGSDKYAFGTSISHYLATNTWTATGDAGLATPTDAIVFKDSTASYLIVCNGSDIRYASTGYGGSQNWAALSTSDAKYLTSYDKRLIGINSTGTVVYYSDRENCDDAAGGAMDFFNISGTWTAAYDLWEGKLLTTDEPVIYMLTDVGLVAIDFWTRVAYLMEVRYPKTSNAMCGMYWNSEIYCSTGSGITKVSAPINPDFGPNQGDGLPSDYVGYIYDMLGSSYWIVICVSNSSKSTILKRHISLGGWHEVYSSSNNIRCLMWSSATAPGQLWFQDGTNIKYIQFPDTTHDVSKVSGYAYNTSGTLIYPAMSKVSVIPKIAVAVDALTSGCDANNTITISGRCDANITSNTDANWTSYGAFNTNGHPTELSLGSSVGIAFNDIQLKAVLASNSNTTSPSLKSLALKYVTSPPVVSAWSFDIAAKGSEAKSIITNMAAARDASTLIVFSPDGDTGVSSHYVRVESLPAVRDLDDYATEKRYTVVVTEVS
jgi:hypothetical protein